MGIGRFVRMDHLHYLPNGELVVVVGDVEYAVAAADDE